MVFSVETLKCGVIGLGMMGEIFSNILNDLPHTYLQAVSDINAERLSLCCKKYGAVGYADYCEMLDKETLDCVFLCTPDNLHLKPAVEVLQRAKHHIFMEKPLSNNLDEAQIIADMAESYERTFMVGHTLRYDPRMNRAWEAVQEGKLGDVIHMRTWRQTCIVHALKMGRNSNSMFFIGIHDIDAMLWLNQGAVVDRVYAEAVKKKMPQEGYDVVDAIFAVFHFDNGAIATHNSSWILPQTQQQVRSNTLHAGFELAGTKGVINLEMH